LDFKQIWTRQNSMPVLCGTEKLIDTSAAPTGTTDSRLNETSDQRRKSRSITEQSLNNTSHLGANSGGLTSKTKRNWSCHKCHGKFQTLSLEPFLTRKRCHSSSCSMVWVTFDSVQTNAEFVNSWSKEGQLCQVEQASSVWLLGWRYSPGHFMPSES
jgi:protein-arginine kinase activator protein McsA